MINYFGGVSPETPPFYVHSKKGRGKMLTRIFGAVTGGRLNLRAAANSSAAIIASIPNETLCYNNVSRGRQNVRRFDGAACPPPAIISA